MKVNRLTVKYVLFYLAIILLVLGGIGFFRGMSISHNSVKTEITKEKLPLSDLEGIVVDKAGNIYCGLQFFSRVQVYNKHGKFQYGLKIEAYEGAFVLDLNKDDNLMVSTFQGQEAFVFDKTGRLIKKYKTSTSWDDKNRYTYDDITGIEYRIKNPFLNPHIVKIKGDKENTIITQSFFEWLLMGSFLSWLFAVIGLLLIFYLFGIISILTSKYK